MAARAYRLGIFLAALTLLGCGESSSSSQISKIRFESAGVDENGAALPSSECGYGTIWLPLEWGALPDDTEELLLYVGQFHREDTGRSQRIVVPYASAIVGIGPVRREIAVNTIPRRGKPAASTPSAVAPAISRGRASSSPCSPSTPRGRRARPTSARRR